jgi:hypothetical protein
MGGAISQAVSRRPAAAKALVQTKGCVICGGQSGSVGGFPLSVSFHHCSILIVSYILLLPVGQTGEAVLFRKQGSKYFQLVTQR